MKQKRLKTLKKRIKNIFFLNIFDKIKINLFIIPFFYLSFILGFFELLLISFITALIHECFHILAMKTFNVPVKNIEIQPFGVCAHLCSISVYNSFKEAFIALSGPFYNFVAAFILSLISKHINSEYINFAIKINLSMGIFNLIPALPLDGGRILRSFLCMKFGILKAYNFMLHISNRLIFLMLLSGVIILLFAPFNFSLILISAFLLSNITNEEKSINHIILKEILETKDKTNIKVPRYTKVITVSENTLAKCIFRLLSFDYYLFFVILKNDGKIKAYASENEILDLLFKKGIRAKFSDIK